MAFSNAYNIRFWPNDSFNTILLNALYHWNSLLAFALISKTGKKAKNAICKHTEQKKKKLLPSPSFDLYGFYSFTLLSQIMFSIWSLKNWQKKQKTPFSNLQNIRFWLQNNFKTLKLQILENVLKCSFWQTFHLNIFQNCPFRSKDIISTSSLKIY